jgi:hypothetical protein
MKSIEQMAEEAGFYACGEAPGVAAMLLGPGPEPGDCRDNLARFAALVAERCAEICKAPSNEQLAACASTEWDSLACAEAITAEFPKS